MMLLDIDDIVKRVSIVVGSIIVVAGIAATTWYNSNLKDEFVDGQTETNNLREETSRLGAHTDELRYLLSQKTQELKQNINLTKDDTVKLDREIKTVQETNVKNQTETRSELQKLLSLNAQLYELLKVKEQELKREQEKIRSEYKQDIAEREQRLELEISKLKDMNVAFSALLKQRDREIEELTQKINREIELRNKYPWNR